ncbi:MULTISPECIES: methylated-DNA--[protein]-cysteine S-methyltransferase [unclassified Lentimicrobium]|uniref:methylated-DNA--[protein]-cysteine S-methyltransferase n=1 Tax=unclassified Lentimicrobium TaxID=2677434 RepID=UPI00155308A6|nr:MULTISPECIES: methylated-DNA--[protein]-cysteine S-methyltransferase [unclassified Lentimicrobium]NPD46310.1 methylated-DNA--[protein]-cysteine S-methyltransferase [Lentimicrobium sp. S6]NPD85298.1 methylated-DNA--[protein]-cysteine S-methyltransferase [Lentimicrobium sp. L6]
MSENILIKYHKTPYGELMLGSYEDRLCLCDWRFRKMRPQIDKRILTQLKTDYEEGNSEVIEKAIIQLEEYFSGTRTQFDLPILLVGSDFQKTVWEALLAIPFGETNTYLGLSKDLNNEKAIRAVATANGANAISIIVPCHRIIGSDGKLVGYAGGLSAKKKLLKLEGSWNPSQLSLF